MRGAARETRTLLLQTILPPTPTLILHSQESQRNLSANERIKMSSLRKLKSGSWQVAIRKKDQPVIYKTYKEKGLASKFGKDVEARMQRNIFEDYSGASATTPTAARIPMMATTTRSSIRVKALRFI